MIIQYSSWGFTTGRFFSPDGWTVIIMLNELFIAGIIVSVGLIIQFVAPRVAPYLGPYKYELKEVKKAEDSKNE